MHASDEVSNRPCAAPGLSSYRYRGNFGWVMIGARDDADALRESLRSTNIGGDIARLEVWTGEHYTPIGKPDYERANDAFAPSM